MYQSQRHQELVELIDEAQEVLADNSMADYHEKARKQYNQAVQELKAMNIGSQQQKTSRTRNNTDKRSQAYKAKRTKQAVNEALYEGGKKPKEGNKRTAKKAKAKAEIDSQETEKKQAGTIAPKKEAPQQSPQPPKGAKQKKVKTPFGGKGADRGAAFVPHFTAEQEFMKKVLAVNGKKQTIKQLTTLLKGYNKKAVTKLIDSKQPHAKLMGQVANNLFAVHKDLLSLGEQSFDFTLQPDTLAALQAAVGKEVLQVQPSVALLKTFVSYQNGTPSKKGVEDWLKQAAKIPANDAYRKELDKAMLTLREYKTGASNFVYLSQQQLKGLAGIVAPQPTSPPTPKGGVKKRRSNLGSIDEQNLMYLPSLSKVESEDKNKTIENSFAAFGKQHQNWQQNKPKNLKAPQLSPQTPKGGFKKEVKTPFGGRGAKTPRMISSMELESLHVDSLKKSEAWESILGKHTPKNVAVMLAAREGQGKTITCLAFAKDFIENNNGKVAYISSEQYGSPIFTEQVQTIGAKSPKLDIGDSVPANLEPYSLIVIDSVNDLHLTDVDIEDLRAKYPDKAFFIVVRQNHDSSYRGKGATDIAFDSDITIELTNGTAKNFKNRCGACGSLDIFELVGYR